MGIFKRNSSLFSSRKRNADNREGTASAATACDAGDQSPATHSRFIDSYERREDAAAASEQQSAMSEYEEAGIETRASFANDDEIFLHKENRKLRGQLRAAGWLSGVLWFFIFVLAAILIFLFFFLKRLPDAQYYYWRGAAVCSAQLRNDCAQPDGQRRTDHHGALEGDRILTDRPILSDWGERTNPRFVLQNKVEAMDVNYSILSNSNPNEIFSQFYLNTGNVMLGLHEESRSHDEGNRARVEAGVHYLLAGANGDFDARELSLRLNLTRDQRKAAQRAFEEMHVLNGAEGYLRLAQMYLYNVSVNDFNPGYPHDAPPRYIDHEIEHFDVDFLVTNPNYAKAYEAAHKAVKCNHPDALQWRSYIAAEAPSTEDLERAKIRAEAELDSIAQRTVNGIEDHCEANTFRQRINRITDQAVIYRLLVDRRSWPTIQELVNKMQLPEAEFDRWIGVLIRESYNVYGFDNQYSVAPYGAPSRVSPYNAPNAPGSQYYRESPAADVTDTADAQSKRAAYLACSDNAAASLAAGDAYLRIGETREAQRYYQQSLTEGRVCAAPAVDKAQKRLAAINLACEYNTESLNRISRDVRNEDPAGDGGGSVIKLDARQLALRAHGYYKGRIDGRYGRGTRAAVQQFQSDFGFDETGDLTPIETVYLICSAATAKNDVASMNALGIMYLTGLGVVQNTDAGMRYLHDAASRGDSDAMFNLATIYGLGTVTSSYRLCGIPENLGRADSWLEDAAARGHPTANLMIDRYQNDPPSERWESYERDMLSDGFFKDQLINTPESCTPNP